MIFTKLLQKMLRKIKKGKNKKKKVIGLMKNKLGAKIMTKFVELKAKTYWYLTNGGSEEKKAKHTKNVCHENKT